MDLSSIYAQYPNAIYSGTTQTSSGGIQANALGPSSYQPANPINYGFTGNSMPSSTPNKAPAPAPQPAQQSSGGGGNSSATDWLYKHGYNNPAEVNRLAQDMPEWLRNQLNGPSDAEKAAQQAAYQKQIDDAYNASNDYLNQAESNVRSQLPDALTAAQSNYDVNASQLGNSQQSAFDTLNQQQTKGTNTYENALADARRIFQEQGMGAQQRFGGASSAGQAASEIQSREQARQFGQTNRQYTDLINNINTQHAGVERDYQTGLLQLQQQKQAAVAQANQDFQNKLLQISNNRAQLAQEKANMALQALQQLRNQVFAIDQQNTQFQQTLALQKQQAQLGLQNYLAQVNGYTNSGNNALSSTNYSQPSNASAATGGLGANMNTQQLVGAAGPQYKRDPYTGLMVPA